MKRALAKRSLGLASLSLLLCLAAPANAADLPEDWLEEQHPIDTGQPLTLPANQYTHPMFKGQLPPPSSVPFGNAVGRTKPITPEPIDGDTDDLLPGRWR